MRERRLGHINGISTYHYHTFFFLISHVNSRYMINIRQPFSTSAAFYQRAEGGILPFRVSSSYARRHID